jgi:beta-RFAP synthase
MNEMEVSELARRVERGRRSALGIHGFAQGGFLVEAGKRTAEAIAPLVARLNFPESWRLVLALPSGEGLHGRDEIEAFRQLRQADVKLPTDYLCRLVLLELLPALAAVDYSAFGEALYEFNRRVGEAFAVVQGGIYASPRVEEMVRFVRSRGVNAVAQSSWGPTLCAVVRNAEEAGKLATAMRRQFGLTEEDVTTTGACNCGHYY